MELFRLYILFTLYLVKFTFGDLLELSDDLGPDSIIFPLGNISTPFEQNSIKKDSSNGFWMAYSEVTFSEPLSTFFAAPYMYYEKGRTVDKIPFWNLFAEVATIDVSDKVSENSAYEVTAEDVVNWIEENGDFPKHCIIIFVTGWDAGRDQEVAENNNSTNEELGERKHPGVSLEAIETLFEYEQNNDNYFVGFGSDTPTLDSAPSELYPVVHLVAEKNRYSLANLKDVKKLPAVGAKLLSMPMKVENGPCAPARIVAMLP